MFMKNFCEVSAKGTAVKTICCKLSRGIHHHYRVAAFSWGPLLYSNMLTTVKG